MLTRHAKWLSCFLAVFLLFLQTGCDIIMPEEEKREENNASSSFFGEGEPRIGLITDAGGLTGSMYAAAWAGLENVRRETGAAVGHAAARSAKDYDTRLLELQKKGADVIITIGQSSAAAVMSAAKNNSKLKYVIVDAYWQTEIPANVLLVNYKGEEAGFLAGYLAARQSGTNVVGFIQNRDDYLSQRYYYGFKEGIALVNPNIELMKGIAGESPSSYHIQEMAAQMQACKTDIIFHIVGAESQGIINAAVGKDLYMIGSGTDQRAEAPGTVLTSAVKRYDHVLESVISDLLSGGVLVGQEIFYGLADGVWEIPEPAEELLKLSIYEQMLQYQEKIEEGIIEVPYMEE